MNSFTLTTGAFEALNYLAPRTRIKVIDAVVMKIFSGKDPDKLPKKAMMAYLLLLEIASAQAAAQSAKATSDTQETSDTQHTSDTQEKQPNRPKPEQNQQPARSAVHSGRPMDALHHIRSRKAKKRR